MLSIRSIALTDFGPFKDEQRIEFPADNGVSILYGENMRGRDALGLRVQRPTGSKLGLRRAGAGVTLSPPAGREPEVVRETTTID